MIGNLFGNVVEVIVVMGMCSGIIIVSVSVDGGEICIVICDDGEGFDLENVLIFF